MEAVKKLRKRRGWTIQELADASETSHFTVNEIELGKRNPRGGTLQKIAKALDVPVSALFDEEPADPKGSAPSRPEKEAAEGQVARLERHVESIRAIAEELDPEGSALDRMTAEFIRSRLREIEGVLPSRENTLANPLGDTLETEGEVVEGTMVKTTRPKSKQS